MKGFNVLGDNIRKFTLKQRLTAKELAAKIGISETHLSYISNQKRTPSFDLLEKIAETLKVSVDRLTGESVSSIIENRLEETGMTLEELSEKTRVPSHWLRNLDTFVPGEMGEYEIGYDWMTRIAKTIGLPEGRLRAALARQEIPAYDGPRNSPEEDFKAKGPNMTFTQAHGRIHRTHFIPVLGSVPAGVPLEAIEDIVGWEEIPKNWLVGNREYFALRVRGDSMYPEYLDGDVVIVRKQPTCDSGDDCVVIINDKDATLKRVHIFNNHIELKAINKMYGRRKYTNEEVHSLPVTILGIVVEMRRKKK